MEKFYTQSNACQSPDRAIVMNPKTVEICPWCKKEITKPELAVFDAEMPNLGALSCGKASCERKRLAAQKPSRKIDHSIKMPLVQREQKRLSSRERRALKYRMANHRSKCEKMGNNRELQMFDQRMRFSKNLDTQITF
jgi:hypothetical protein